MTRVLLINPPELQGYSNERTYSGGIGVSRKLKPFEKDDLILPPIDMLYTAAVAERAGARVVVADLLLDRLHGPAAERYCLDKLDSPAGSDDWIGVRLSIPSLGQDLEFAHRIKALCPESKVFVFGSVIMNTIDHWVRDTTVDFLLYGEPEALIGEALAAADYRKAPGVIVPKSYIPLAGEALFDGGANADKNGRWAKVKDMAALPMPAWHLLEMPRYARHGRMDEIGVMIQASRGCPIGCNMCPYMVLEGKPWRSNAIDAVVDEIEHLNKTYGIYRIRFRDPNFGFNRKYARELCEAIIARGVKLEATVETSVEVFDEDNLRKMYDAGIRTITTGIETADAACMESIGQKISVNDKLQERIALCHQIGFHIYGTFCLGMPEETWDTVEGTWMFANELDVESGFTVLTPFPGTPLYWRALKEGYIPRRMRYSDWNSYTSTMRTNTLTTRDLDMARLWARLETILPYRLNRAKEKGGSEVARFYWKHVPHFLARIYCRAYVWYRRSRQAESRRTLGAPALSAE